METDGTPGAAGESSGGADDRFAARIRGLVDLQREVDAQAAEWAERRGPRTGDHSARLAVESVRSLLLLKMAELTEREEPPSIEEVAYLALALHRIEAANRHRLAREQATAESCCSSGPAQAPFHAGNEGPPRPGHQGGVSPRTPGFEAVGALAGYPRACRARRRTPADRPFLLERIGVAVRL